MQIGATQKSVDAFKTVYQSLASGAGRHTYLKITVKGIFFKDYFASVVDNRDERSSLKDIAKCASYLRGVLGDDPSTLASRNILLLSVQKIKEVKGKRLSNSVSEGKVCGLGLCCENRQIKAMGEVEMELLAGLPRSNVNIGSEEYHESTDTPMNASLRSQESTTTLGGPTEQGKVLTAG